MSPALPHDTLTPILVRLESYVCPFSCQGSTQSPGGACAELEERLREELCLDGRYVQGLTSWKEKGDLSISGTPHS